MSVQASRKGYASPVQVARHLALCRAQVYKLIDMGMLRALRIPGSGKRATIRIPWEEVERLERETSTK